MLLVPPFYYKGVSDEGLYRWHAEVFETVGSRLPGRDPLQHPGADRSHYRPAAGRPTAPRLSRSRGRRQGQQRRLGAHDGASRRAPRPRDSRRARGPPRSGRAERRFGRDQRRRQHRAAADRGTRLRRRNSLIDWALERLLAMPVVPALKAVLAEERDNETWRAVRPPLKSIDSGPQRGICIEVAARLTDFEGA